MRTRYPARKPTRANQGAAMVLLLCNATDEAFGKLDVETLCRRYPGVRRDAVEKAFGEAKGRRAGRGF